MLRRLDQVNNEVKEDELLLEKTDRLLEEMERNLGKLEASADYKTRESASQQLPIIREEHEHHDLPTDHGHSPPVCEQEQGNIPSDHAHSQYIAACEDDIAKIDSNISREENSSKKEKKGDLNDVDDTLECPDTESEQVLEEGRMVYATITPCMLTPWHLATVLSLSTASCELQFPTHQHSVTLPLSQVACSFPSGTEVTVGTRCLALYEEDGFYAGVVGEVPKAANKWRYLVFYDDGYASYADLGSLRQVCKSYKHVWVGVAPGNRDFIERYLKEYPWRKMVKLKVGDKIITELSNDWVLGEVTEVDASLVEITFEDQEACELIYRGSERLQPMQKLLQSKEVAKPAPTGYLVKQSVPGGGSVAYQVHECSPACVALYPYQPSLHRSSSPLTIPLHLGWRREVSTHKDSEVLGNWTVFYISPCGKRMRNMEEVHTMLSIYKSNLTVDLFVFDCWVNVLNEFQASKDLLCMADISHGVERTAVPACNPYSSTPPPFMEYSTTPDTQPGVRDISCAGQEFLVGCDCRDDCQDKERCTCRQLTIQATACDLEGVVNTSAGYVYRRLPDVVLTGIYECNQTCACSTTCLNRVVQATLIRAKLQVFMTKSKGWGIRTLVDLPQGSFICTYVGKVYASEREAGFEDAYFADMDMIEVVERRKEGYESDISDENDEDSLMDIDATNNNESEKNEKPKLRGTRQLFGTGQEVFIMDAKEKGNIGRYFNHSCNPNTFVQNVFVSQHDIRLPTIAFFTCKFVAAGTELCWDYSYKVGALPGKEIACHCGEDNCRKRLL